VNPPQTTLLLGIGGLVLGIAAGLAAFSSASNPLPPYKPIGGTRRDDAPRSRKEIAKIDAGVQRAIAYPRCPDCGKAAWKDPYQEASAKKILAACQWLLRRSGQVAA